MALHIRPVVRAWQLGRRPQIETESHGSIKWRSLFSTDSHWIRWPASGNNLLRSVAQKPPLGCGLLSFVFCLHLTPLRKGMWSQFGSAKKRNRTVNEHSSYDLITISFRCINSLRAMKTLKAQGKRTINVSVQFGGHCKQERYNSGATLRRTAHVLPLRLSYISYTMSVSVSHNKHTSEKVHYAIFMLSQATQREKVLDTFFCWGSSPPMSHQRHHHHQRG